MYLGIDYGAKRVGVAVSDEEGRVAFPYSVVPEKEALDVVTDLAKERGIAVAVIGESKNFAGEDNPVMERIKAFARELEEAGLSVRFEPEFMTSAQAARAEGEQGTLDASAAALILQSFLDKRRRDTI